MTRFILPIVLLVLISGCAAPLAGEHARLGSQELSSGAMIHYVRIRSGLSEEEAMAVLHRRAEQFRRVPGLVQKVYGHDAETGEICGIYIFESQAALDRFRQSELALTIRDAYQVESARVERYDVVFTLHPGVRAE